MSIYLNSLLKPLAVTIIILLFSACQSVPVPEPEPETKPEASTAVEEAPEAEVVDINRQTYEAGLTALKNGKLSFAIELLKQASTSAPELEFVFTNLGLAYYKQEDFLKSEKAFQRAIQYNKNDSIAYNHLGIIKRMQGDFAGAKKAYQKAISINRNYAEAHLNLGILYDIYLQNLKAALKQYTKYQSLTKEKNKSVAGWISDINRQLKSGRLYCAKKKK